MTPEERKAFRDEQLRRRKERNLERRDKQRQTRTEAKRAYDRKQRALDISPMRQMMLASATPARRSADIRERAYQAVQREVQRLWQVCADLPEPKLDDLVRYRMAAPRLRF